MRAVWSFVLLERLVFYQLFHDNWMSGRDILED